MSLVDAFLSLPEDENELRARTARAAKAKALIDDPIFRDALVAVRAGVVKELTTCRVNDLDGLRQYRLMFELLDRIATAIAQHIRTGQLAEDALKRIGKPRMFGRQ